MREKMRLILSVTLCIIIFAVVLPQAAKAAWPPVIYIDTSGIDARLKPPGDLTAQQIADLKYWILWHIRYNLESAVGKGNVMVTNDPTEEAHASRKVRILNQRSVPPSRCWGECPRGSDTVNVYLGEYMDDPTEAVTDAFKTNGNWDVFKLANGIGAVSSHEIGHTYGVGHNKHGHKDSTGLVDKMTDGLIWTEKDPSSSGGKILAENTWIYDAEAREKIKQNWGMKPPKSVVDYAHKALITDFWGEELLPGKLCEYGGLNAFFNFSGPLASEFYVGILGQGSDGGFDFIYESSMEGLGADAQMLTFFVGAQDYTQWLLVGAPNTTWASTWFMLPEDNLHLYNFVTQPDGDYVARLVVMDWDVDGTHGAVQVTLDANAFGNYSNPYNGFRYEYVSLPVGGISVHISVPVDKPALLAPYIALTSIIIAATVTTSIYSKHVKRKNTKSTKE